MSVMKFHTGDTFGRGVCGPWKCAAFDLGRLLPRKSDILLLDVRQVTARAF